MLAIAVIAALVAVPAAQANKGDGNGWKVVASGLDNPRGLDVAKNGDIWIAEAGKGGAGPCVAEPRGSRVAAGLLRPARGAFTVVHKGWQKRVVSGLPSFATQGTGDDADGSRPTSSSTASSVTGLIGGGHTPEQRASLGKRRRAVRHGS